MMLVSLFSYCQYPTVKTIGKDTVVIMTLKQGQEINEKFSTLSDSILILKKNITERKNEIVVLDFEKKNLDSTIIKFQDRIVFSEKEINRLNEQLKIQDLKFWREKKTWVGWMLFSFFMIVTVGALK